MYGNFANWKNMSNFAPSYITVIHEMCARAYVFTNIL